MANHPRCLGPQVGNNLVQEQQQGLLVVFDAFAVERVQWHQVVRNAIRVRRCTICR